MEEIETGAGIRRQSRLECDPERAWRALTRPEELSRWLGGEVELELRPGGDLTVTGPDGEERPGFVESVEPPARIVFWWRRPDADESSRVEISIEPDPEAVEGSDSCVVTVVESLPMLVLERRLAEISGAGGESGPVASAAGAASGATVAAGGGTSLIA